MQTVLVPADSAAQLTTADCRLGDERSDRIRGCFIRLLESNMSNSLYVWTFHHMLDFLCVFQTYFVHVFPAGWCKCVTERLQLRLLYQQRRLPGLLHSLHSWLDVKHRRTFVRSGNNNDLLDHAFPRVSERNWNWVDSATPHAPCYTTSLVR